MDRITPTATTTHIETEPKCLEDIYCGIQLRITKGSLRIAFLNTLKAIRAVFRRKKRRKRARLGYRFRRRATPRADFPDYGATLITPNNPLA